MWIGLWTKVSEYTYWIELSGQFSEVQIGISSQQQKPILFFTDNTMIIILSNFYTSFICVPPITEHQPPHNDLCGLQ